MVAKGKMSGGMCSCTCHKSKKFGKGAFLVLLGLVFLLNSLGLVMDSTASFLWPVFVLVLGIGVLLKGCCKCCNNTC